VSYVQIVLGCVCADADCNLEMLQTAATVSGTGRDLYCRQCCQTAACQRSCRVVWTNRDPPWLRYSGHLRRINASTRCWSDELALDAYCGLATTTDLYTTCSAVSFMLWFSEHTLSASTSWRRSWRVQHYEAHYSEWYENNCTCSYFRRLISKPVDAYTADPVDIRVESFSRWHSQMRQVRSWH